MCRAKQIKNKKNKAKCPNFEGPILNRDKCYATPAFILPSEKVSMIWKRSTTSKVHEKSCDNIKKEWKNRRSKSTTWYIFPNPVCPQATLKKYVLQRVQVELWVILGCKIFVTKHIQSCSHKLNIRNAEFNLHILDL